MAVFVASPPLHPWTWRGVGPGAGTQSHALARTLGGPHPAGAGAAEALAELALRKEGMRMRRKREALWKHSFTRNQLNLPHPCCFLRWPRLLWGICFSYPLRKENCTHLPAPLLVSPPPASLQPWRQPLRAGTRERRLPHPHERSCGLPGWPSPIPTISCLVAAVSGRQEEIRGEETRSDLPRRD